MKKTKVIATIGPSSSDAKTVLELINNGTNIFRINFSHGSFPLHKANVELIRKTAKKQNKIVSILGDIQGPKIRIGNLKDGAITLTQGRTITITEHDVLGDENIISSSYKGLINLKPKDKLLLDDGLFSLEVISTNKQKKELYCKVLVGGILKSRKGINIPYTNINISPLTEKDKKSVDFALEEKLDYLALSFVKDALDIETLRSLIQQKKGSIPIIAKIERPEAIDNIHKIIETADGLMVARGDLGVEMPLEKVPLLQKSIVLECNRMSKPVIIATQMLESMIKSPRATRAEVSDVANAILDGADAVMLSGETAAGLYPVESIKTMYAIAREIENSSTSLYNRKHGIDPAKDNDTEEAIAIAACEMAHNLGAKAITIYTNNSSSVQLLSKYHPMCPLIALTSSEKTARIVNLYWSVIPKLIAASPKAKPTNSEKLEITNAICKNTLANRIIIIDTIGKRMNSIRVF